MAIYYRQVNHSIIISGKTYPYKNRIKELGGTFSGQDKVWTMMANEQTLEAVAELCKSVGGGPLKVPSPKFVAEKAPIKIESNTPFDAGAQTVEGLSVKELMDKVDLHIKQAFPRAVWVYGEIQSLNVRSGAVYLQIADFKENSSKSNTITINCTIWKQAILAVEKRFNGKLASVLQEGLKIRVLSQLNLFKDRASLSLNILDIDPSFTKGALALEREKLLKDLRRRGLDRLNKSIIPHLFPLKIGLISASGSRAVSDFIDQLRSYHYPGNILFMPTQMQGENTIKAVCHAIQELNLQSCDYIVLTRGGGSQADLRWFDNKDIAEAIAHSKVPIIAAIGHHDDVCVAEEIAFRREKTPTAAADFIVSEIQSIILRIDRSRQRIQEVSRLNLQRFAEHLESQSKNIKLLLIKHLSDFFHHLQGLLAKLQQNSIQQLNRVFDTLNNHKLRIYHLADRHYQVKQGKLQNLENYVNRNSLQRIANYNESLNQKTYQLRQSTLSSLHKAEVELNHKASLVKSLDPSPWMSKGWTQITKNKQRIKSIKDLKLSDTVHFRLKDGHAELEVKHLVEGRQK